jgi:hypothetical protein
MGLLVYEKSCSISCTIPGWVNGIAQAVPYVIKFLCILQHHTDKEMVLVEYDTSQCISSTVHQHVNGLAQAMPYIFLFSASPTSRNSTPGI